MNTLLVRLHILAVALWFGAVAFFTLSGVLIFNAYRDVSRLPTAERPLWLPLPPAFDRDDLGEGFPSPLRLEQGSRAAGVAVGSIFPTYYLLQTIAGVVVFVTMHLPARWGHFDRTWLRRQLAGVALSTAVLGWGIEMHVAHLRVARNELTDRVLRDPQPAPEHLAEARAARAEFGRWHGYSLVQNFITLGLVTALVWTLPGVLAPRRTT